MEDALVSGQSKIDVAWPTALPVRPGILSVWDMGLFCYPGDPSAEKERTNMKVISKPVSLFTSALVILTVLIASMTVLSQTEIKLRSNKYSEADDVKLGHEAAGEIEKKLTLVRDNETSRYLASVGNRLAQAIPEQFQHGPFEYTFKVVDAKEINAFALPGGPMYVNTGMIAAAKREGEMAGVMAHEIAHVALRHGTAQATKGQKYQTLGALGQIGGAILGGAAGAAVGQGAQMGAGMYMLKFSREYETEADILGAQILARSGYDPRDLGEMFKTIQSQGGSGGPQFLSSHPNPENRYQRIDQEAKMLRVVGTPPDDRDFRRIQARITGGSAAMSDGGDPRRGGAGEPPRGGGLGKVEPPSAQYRTYSDNTFTISIPDNWADLPGQEAVWFSPPGGYGDANGQAQFTHGVNAGVAQTQAKDLATATRQFVSGIQKENPNLKQAAQPVTEQLSGRTAYRLRFTNVSDATGGTEIVEMYTAQLRNGGLFYLITVVPQNDARNYQQVIGRITGSLKIRD